MYRVAIGEEMCREFQEGERPPEATLVNNFPGDMDDQAGDDSAPDPMEVVLPKGRPFDPVRATSVTAERKLRMKILFRSQPSFQTLSVQFRSPSRAR